MILGGSGCTLSGVGPSGAYPPEMTRGDLRAAMDDALRAGDPERWCDACEAFLGLCTGPERRRFEGVLEAMRTALGDEDLRPEGYVTAAGSLALLGEVLGRPGAAGDAPTIDGCDVTWSDGRARLAARLVMPRRLMRGQPPVDIRAKLGSEAVAAIDSPAATTLSNSCRGQPAAVGAGGRSQGNGRSLGASAARGGSRVRRRPGRLAWQFGMLDYA